MRRRVKTGNRQKALAFRQKRAEEPHAARPRRPELHGAELRHYLKNKARGDECEALVRRVLSRPDRPWWIWKVRAKRYVEDKSGIDVVIHTADMGRLFLQVKRSTIGAQQWLADHAGDPRPIRVIVAHEEEDPEIVYGRALGALILLREGVGGAPWP